MSSSGDAARFSNIVKNQILTQQPPLIKDVDDKTADDTIDVQQQQYLQIWLRPDCYTLYKTHIFPQSTPIKKRAGMIRYSINVAYNLKKRYPLAQFLEFGVATGKDMIRIMNYVSHKEQHLASSNNNNAKRTIIHGFDSFHGLPEIWDNGQVNHETGQAIFGQGHFDTGGHAPILDALQQTMCICHHGNKNSNNKDYQCPVEFHIGLFQDTVPTFFTTNPQYATTPIAFIHADADLYSSTMTFLEEICLRRLLIPGSVILFDEYTNHPNWQDNGEYRAWMEICDRYKLDFDYLCHHAPNTAAIVKNCNTSSSSLSSYGYQSVSVIITKVGSRVEI